MRKSLELWFAFGIGLAAIEGCGSSESGGSGGNPVDGGSNTGGSSGSMSAGGSSGRAGAGGSSGRAGAGGSSGSSGAGGSSGQAGSGGTSTSSGGTSSGGAAGKAGQDAGNPDAAQPDAGCTTGFADCDGNTANGCEASLASDTHCGSCARDCTIDGTTCSSGMCGVVQLFSATDMPFGTDNAAARSWAFDPTTASAFWVGFNGYSVRRFPLDGSAASVVWQPASTATAGTESIAVTGGNVYWSIGGSPATVFKKAVGVAASVNPTQAFFPVARASFLRVQGSSFYWVSGDYQDPTPEPPTHVGYVYARSIAAPQSDGGTAIVTVDQGNFGNFQAFQPTSDALYWVTSAAGTGVAFELRTTPLAGGTPAAVPKITGSADTAVAVAYGILPSLVADGKTLYFTRTVATSSLNGIYRYAKGDTAPTQLVIAEGVTSVLVDSAYIYFLQRNSNNVFRAPIAGGAAEAIAAAGGYKIIAQDAKYLYLLQSASGSSTLAKVIK